MNAAAASAGPTRESQRIPLLDILRGFAIMGILLVNFSGPVRSEADTLIWRGLSILVLGSFYPLFSFLFGFGFALQRRRALARGKGTSILYLRRLAVLFMLGTVHSVLIWSGDILVDYAVFGLLLVLATRLPVRLIPVLIVSLVTFSIGYPPAAQRYGDVSDPRHPMEQLREGVLAEQLTIAQNIRQRTDRSFLVDVSGRWTRYAFHLRQFMDWTYLLARDLLPLFLIGYWAARKRWLDRVEEHRRAVTWAAYLGFGAALVGVAYSYDAAAGPEQAARAASMLANYGITAFYIATLSLAVALPSRLSAYLGIFSPVGRTALSNYLLQSIVMTWLFVPYGINMSRPSVAIFMLLNLGFFFLVQIPLSRWWLTRFRFGPAEWLWRTLTNAKPQPIRRQGEGEQAPALVTVKS